MDDFVHFPTPYNDMGGLGNEHNLSNKIVMLEVKMEQMMLEISNLKNKIERINSKEINLKASSKKDDHPKVYEIFNERIKNICSKKFAEDINMEVYFEMWVDNCTKNNLFLMEVKNKVFYNWIKVYEDWFNCGNGVGLKRHCK